MLFYLKYLKYFFVKKYPAEITFFVTANCNFHCRHCFNLEKIEKGDIKNELTAEEIEKISRTIPAFMRLSLSGGEPFLKKDLPEICRIFHKNCRVKFISIPTNAYATQKILTDVEQIVSANPGLFLHISLSVDGLGKNRDYIVGRENTCQSLIKTAQGLKKLQKLHPNLSLGVITTQSPDNQNEIGKIYKFCRETLKVDNFGFNIARSYSKEKIGTNVSADLKIFQDFSEKLMREDTSALKIPLSGLIIAKRNMIFKRILKTYLEKKYQSPCFSGNLRIVIDETGNVYPCETLQYCKGKESFLMGNLKDYELDFKKLFFSDKARRIKTYIAKTKCFCAHECDMETNILFNARFAPRLLWETLKIYFKKHANKK